MTTLPNIDLAALELVTGGKLANDSYVVGEPATEPLTWTEEVRPTAFGRFMCDNLGYCPWRSR